MDESIFKIRDLESTVNTIGARVDQAQVKDIIAKLNAIVRNNTIYTADNIKDIQNEKTYIGEGKKKMVVILEMILWYNNENDTIKLNEDDYSIELINLDEKINYSDIESIQINMYDINNPSNILEVKIKLNHISNYTTFNNSIIYLEFYSNMELLECNYNLLK